MEDKEMKIQEDIIINQYRLTQHLVFQNKRFREALKFYRDTDYHEFEKYGGEGKYAKFASYDEIAYQALEVENYEN